MGQLEHRGQALKVPDAGANLEVDVPWKYLNFFLEDDDELAEIGRRYAGGDENMMSGHVKKRLAEVRLPCTVLIHNALWLIVVSSGHPAL